MDKRTFKLLNEQGNLWQKFIIAQKERQREKFEKTKLVRKKDGALWNPEANPLCKTCGGLGILNGVNCPDCWK